MDSKLQAEIAGGASLKHAETVDKSAPQIDSNVTQKKKEAASFKHELLWNDDTGNSKQQVSNEIYTDK
jgi:hypothetical protein